MRFIVNAQLPKSLSDLLNNQGFDSLHTLDLPNQNRTSDKAIVKLSKEQERIIITKALDFLSFLVKSQRQKLILIRTGSIPKSASRHFCYKY